MIQRRERFTKAADRLYCEPQSIRRHEPSLYEVTNKAKGHVYHVRVERRAGVAKPLPRPRKRLATSTLSPGF